MIVPPINRPHCSSIIIVKELGDKMQIRYEELYRRAIRSKAHNDFKDCDLNTLRNLFTDIESSVSKNFDGFRIHLGLNSGVLVFLFRGMNNLKDAGDYFQISPNGSSHDRVDSGVAQGYIDAYALEILSLSAINNNLHEGNTKSYAYQGLFGKFLAEFRRHTNNSPIKKIRIKLSVCVDNITNPEFNDRIIVGFSFLAGNVEIYLPDLDGPFGCDIPKFRAPGPGADTGSPCPPSANCP